MVSTRCPALYWAEIKCRLYPNPLDMLEEKAIYGNQSIFID
jgi:hypothetical protein